MRVRSVVHAPSDSTSANIVYRIQALLNLLSSPAGGHRKCLVYLEAVPLPLVGELIESICGKLDIFADTSGVHPSSDRSREISLCLVLLQMIHTRFWECCSLSAIIMHNWHKLLRAMQDIWCAVVIRKSTLELAGAEFETHFICSLISQLSSDEKLGLFIFKGHELRRLTAQIWFNDASDLNVVSLALGACLFYSNSSMMECLDQIVAEVDGGAERFAELLLQRVGSSIQSQSIEDSGLTLYLSIIEIIFTSKATPPQWHAVELAVLERYGPFLMSQVFERLMLLPSSEFSWTIRPVQSCVKIIRNSFPTTNGMNANVILQAVKGGLLTGIAAGAAALELTDEKTLECIKYLLTIGLPGSLCSYVAVKACVKSIETIPRDAIDAIRTSLVGSEWEKLEQLLTERFVSACLFDLQGNQKMCYNVRLTPCGESASLVLTSTSCSAMSGEPRPNSKDVRTATS